MARARTPKQAAEQGDLRGAPLSPTDGFVLSRIDGTLDEHEIVGLSGLPAEIVRTSLRKLESLGLITFDGEATASNVPRAPVAEGSHPSPAREEVTFSPGRPSSPKATEPAARRDPQLTPEEESALMEEVDLDADTRHVVVLTYRSLPEADHYSLLKVDRSADRKTLKRAYYDLASKFHPDRYFRKNLGSYKVRMEAIFGRITLAHDTLTDKARRQEYDAYLEEQRRSRGIEDLLAEALAEATRAEQRIEREVREQEGGTGERSTPVALAGRRDTAQPSSATPPRPSPTESAARRDALARRLLGGRSAPPSPSSSKPYSAAKPPVSSSEAMEALRRRYEDRVASAKAAQARKYTANAQAALAAGDPVAAANAFRVALTLAPNDSDLVRMAEETQVKADAILSETYARQAGYEEKNGQWAEAARSWGRVLKARPKDAGAHEHAAMSLVKADGDLHEAARLAQIACTLEPAHPAFRVTLANVYLAAGLTLNARRELETAAQLAPHDDTIRAVLERVGKS